MDLEDGERSHARSHGAQFESPGRQEMRERALQPRVSRVSRSWISTHSTSESGGTPNRSDCACGLYTEPHTPLLPVYTMPLLSDVWIKAYFRFHNVKPYYR